MSRQKLLLAFALILVSTGVVLAQGAAGVTYSSGFQIQNLSASVATLTIQYINQDGTVAQTVTDTIAASGAKTYFPIAPPAPFNGSVVVSSDQPLAAIVNTIAAGTVSGGAAANGFSSGATTVNLPLIMRNNYGWTTWFNVQNVGSTVANVSIQFLAGSAGSNWTTTATIQPGASYTFDQNTQTSLGTKFVGSATITSDQPVVATVQEVGSTDVLALMAYDGFTASSNTVAIPLVMSQNYGYLTGIQVQNVGTITSNITVTYSANTVAGMGTPTAETQSAAAGQSKTFLQSGGQWTGKYVGSAIVSSSPVVPLVAIINELNVGATPASNDYGSSYEGFDPASATGTVSIPLVMALNYGYFTGIQIQNVGTSSCSATVTYSANTVAGMGTPTPDARTIAAGSSATVLQQGGQWTGKYVGSAMITGSSCKLVAIVNELGTGNDNLLTYVGFNIAP